MTVLGENIKKARKKYGFSQTALANELGITSAAVSHWETGTSRPTSENIERLEVILGPVNPLSIGVWLYEARKTKNFTMEKLSKTARVSITTINNIENGYTENPRKDTIERLQKALSVDVPEESLRASNEASEITGLGHLTDFSPDLTAKSEWPSVSGVYVLYDISDRPVYVGQSRNIAKRLKEHSDKFWYREPIVKYASYVPIEDNDLRRQTEDILIKFLKSNAVLNKHQVDRGE